MRTIKRKHNLGFAISNMRFTLLIKESRELYLNPFRLNYKKTEDKVTSLFVHVLKQSGLLSELIREIKWDSGEILSGDYNFTSGLQLHNDFMYPVKHAFIGRF